MSKDKAQGVVVKQYFQGGWAGDETTLENIDGTWIAVQGDLCFASPDDLKEFTAIVSKMLESVA